MNDKIIPQTSICALHIPATTILTLSSCMQGACPIGCRSAQMSDQVIIEEPTVASVLICATCQTDCLAAIWPFIITTARSQFTLSAK